MRSILPWAVHVFDAADQPPKVEERQPVHVGRGDAHLCQGEQIPAPVVGDVGVETGVRFGR